MNKSTGLIIAFLLLGGVFVQIPPAQAEPQPFFFSVGIIAALASPGGDITVTLPVHIAYDVLILQVWIRDVANSITVSGWNLLTGCPFDRGAVSRHWVYWLRATSASTPNPLIDTDGTTGDIYGMAAVYRNIYPSGDPLDVVGTPATGTSDPAVIPGLTTAIASDLVVVVANGETDDPTSIVATATDPTTFIEHYAVSTVGADAILTFSEETRITAGATGDVSIDWVGTPPAGWGGIAFTLKPIALAWQGHNSVMNIATSAEAPGVNCPTGGWRIDISWGIDDNDNGVLDMPGETDGTVFYFSCNGAKGDKGDKGDAGASGKQSLIKQTPFSGAQHGCSNGGVQVDSGIDIDGDFILDPGEITATSYVCNGIDGEKGDTGEKGDKGDKGDQGDAGYNSLINLTVINPGGACGPYGGWRFEVGLDYDRDDSLDPLEINATVIFCNTPGFDALVNLQPEPPGGNCTAGGTNFTAGSDLDRDGNLSWDEATYQRFICDCVSCGSGSSTQGNVLQAFIGIIVFALFVIALLALSFLFGIVAALLQFAYAVTLFLWPLMGVTWLGWLFIGFFFTCLASLIWSE